MEKYLNQLMTAQGGGVITQNIVIAYDVINIMICEIQYGGKVSDNIDREILKAYGDRYFRSALTSSTANEFTLATYTVNNQERKYKLPSGQEHSVFLNNIEEMEPVDSSEVIRNERTRRHSLQIQGDQGNDRDPDGDQTQGRRYGRRRND